MNNFSSSTTSDDFDEYPVVTQAEMDRATFRVGLNPSPEKQVVTLALDVNLIAYFELQAGELDFQTLINETLKKAKEQTELADVLRKVIREELRSENLHQDPP